MPHGLLKDFKAFLGPLASALLSQAMSFVITYAENKIKEYLDYLRSLCPPLKELQKMAKTLEKIQKLLDDFDKKVNTVKKTADSVKPAIRAGTVIVEILSHMPIPSAFPPGIGVPMGIIQGQSNVLVFLRKMVETLDTDSKSVVSIAGVASSVLIPIKLKLATLESILKRCAETPDIYGGSGYTWGKLEGGIPALASMETNISGSFILFPKDVITVDDRRKIISNVYTGSFFTGSYTTNTRVLINRPNLTLAAINAIQVSNSNVNTLIGGVSSNTGAIISSTTNGNTTTTSGVGVGIGTGIGSTTPVTNFNGTGTGNNNTVGSNLTNTINNTNQGSTGNIGINNDTQTGLVTEVGSLGTDTGINNNNNLVGINNSNLGTNTQITGTGFGIEGRGGTTTATGTFIPNLESSTGGQGENSNSKVGFGTDGVFNRGTLFAEISSDTIKSGLNPSSTNPGNIPTSTGIFIDGEEVGFTPEGRLALIASLNDTPVTPLITDEKYNTPTGDTYLLSVLEDTSTDYAAPRRYAVAKDRRGVVVLQGPKSFASNQQVLLNELKYRIDRQLP